MLHYQKNDFDNICFSFAKSQFKISKLIYPNILYQTYSFILYNPSGYAPRAPEFGEGGQLPLKSKF